jgi:hypothetical protein
MVLRLTGFYGNPDFLWISGSTSGHFSAEGGVIQSIISLLNTEKYPPSLQYSLMTLGPIILWLGVSKVDSRGYRLSWVSQGLVLFGRVPLFYYLCHLYLIHLLALAITSMAGQPNEWISFGADPSLSRPEGYGFGLPVIYSVWILTTIILYALCQKYEKYKRNHTYGWLKFL